MFFRNEELNVNNNILMLNSESEKNQNQNLFKIWTDVYNTELILDLQENFYTNQVFEISEKVPN